MRRSRVLIGVAGAALAIMSFATGLTIEIESGAGAALHLTTVNRTLKGDRLLSPAAPSSQNPAGEPSLPHGCELRFSSVRNAYANEVAGRCLAEAPRLLKRAPMLAA